MMSSWNDFGAVTVAAATALLLAVSPPVADAQCPALLWNDEFSGTGLDTSIWEAQIGTGCDISADLCGWGNNELQYYRAENAIVSSADDGVLSIVAREEEFMGNDFTSARIRTLGSVDIDMTQDHLRIEARIQVPEGGNGLWPAFWMLPSNGDPLSWPTGGEIDIMEFIGREPNHAHGYLHYGNAFNDRAVVGGHLYTPDSPADDFHEYAIEKKPGEISFFFDGHKYQTFADSMVEPKFTWPFENDFHFILNVAVGGNWPLYQDDTSSFPTAMNVDYIRVYDFSSFSYGHITGARHVQAFQGSELYCIEESDVSYDSIQWIVPDGASFVDGPPSACISVNFGTSSGYVTAVVMSACGERRFQVPVKVEPWYEKDFALVEPDDSAAATTTDNAELLFASGSYVIQQVDGQPAIQYQRSIGEPYDTIQYSTTSIPNPGAYLNGDFKFFMDVKTTTTPECTHVLIQLEDSTKVTGSNYPVGRHSRYIAYMSADRNWQRLEFDLYDRPDLTSGTVDRITILFDPNMAREDVYFIRNFDSDKTGCLANCEGLPSHSCRKTAKSEEGACTDGVNNDGLGFDGDAPIDCDDADCWDDPACLSTTPAPVTTTSSPITSAPASFPTAAPVSITSAPMTTTTPAPVITPAPTPFPTVSGVGESCSSNPECAKLNLAGPNCCPTSEGTYLYCCEASPGPSPPVPSPPPAPPSSNAGTSCSSNPECNKLNLAGPNCCPTSEGIYLYCCENYQPPVNDDPKCSAHVNCAHLAGPDCCPTDVGQILGCCDNYVPP